jgi:hypothetical protein
MQVRGEHDASMAFVRDLFADGKQTLDFLLSRNRGMELKVGGSRQP